MLVQVSRPNLSLWSSLNYSLPYFALSLALNISVSCLIVARLVHLRCTLTNLLGSEHAIQCTSIIAMIVESALLFSVFSVLSLVTYAMNHPLQNIFLQMLPQIQVRQIQFDSYHFSGWEKTCQIVAPLLIILRVAQGRAWSPSATTLFSNGNASTTQVSIHAPGFAFPVFRTKETTSYPTITRTVSYSVDSYKMNTSASSLWVSNKGT